MAEQPQKSPPAPAVDVAALQARIAQLENALAAKAPTIPAPFTLPEKYKGTKSYTVQAKHYRQGRMFEPGEVITVTDEVPSRTWVPFEVPKVVAPTAPPPAPLRATDQAV